MERAPLLLLVDDEPLLVELLTDALSEGGYAVITACQGGEARGLIEEQSNELAGLVTDVNLNGEAAGWDLARRARELRPDLPVVYTTANPADDWAVEGVPKSLFVAKPFAPAQVLTAISTLITKSASETKPPQ